MITLTALYGARAAARNAAQALEDAGVDSDAISLIEPAEADHDSLGAVAGAGVGALAGGLAVGLGAVTLPGLGAVVAAGWLSSSLAGVAGGALAGGAAGGIVGALIEAGIDGDTADHIARGVGRGDTVLSVRAEDVHRDAIVAILKAHGPRELTPQVTTDEPPAPPPLPVPPPR